MNNVESNFSNYVSSKYNLIKLFKILPIVYYKKIIYICMAQLLVTSLSNAIVLSHKLNSDTAYPITFVMDYNKKKQKILSKTGFA
ncbi:hypothetical protein QTP88_006838 [Uroleucon formosanum]